MLKPALFAISLSVCPFFLTAQTAPDSTVARLEAINRDIWTPFSEAYAAADAEKYIRLHSPDFIRATGSQIFDLKRYAENNRAGFKRGKEAGFATTIRFAFTERVVSAEFASERGIYHYHSDNGKGQVFDGYGKFHVVERLEAGHWKILFDYDSNEGGTIDKADFDAAYLPNDWTVLAKPAFDLNAVRQHINAANERYGERFKTHDPLWYAARYTLDACIMPEKTPRICGLEGIIGYYYNKGENQSIGIRITALEIAGGPEAVVEEGLYEIADDKGTVLDKGKFLATWAPEDGVWKLRREIWTTDGGD
ncbi:MAG: hypothetical protein ACKVUS_00325 [Saprospiraceae bacterium]